MFGQAPTTSPFGAPAPAPFGAPAPAPFGGFGQPAAAPATGGFGAAPASGFGAPATFGQPAAAPSAFGAPATTGAFGQPAPAPAFGAPTGGFGQPTPAPAFGAPAPATGGLFGAPAPATAPFGSPAPAPAFGAKPAGGGLFGSAPAQSGGLFGSAPTPAPGGLFGSVAPAAPFGAPAPATPFGAPAAAPTFGAPAPSAFGAPAPAATGAFGAAPTAGGFGQPQQPQQTQTGSTMAPYQTTQKQDGTNQIVLQAITAMPQYELKSFEELRVEDYMAGNKGTKGQAAPAATGFGGFGAAPQPAPAFGQPAPAAFGAPVAPATGGLFGSAPAPAPSGLFGAPAPAPAFGQPAAAPAFGAPAPAPATGGLFGAPAPAPTGGLFGAPTPAPAFGQPAPAPAFGAPAPATGGLFGAPAPAPTGGLFGASTPAPAFGQPAPAPAFGAPAAAGGLFGAPAPAPAAGGLFGATPAPAAGGLFGQPAPAPSLFGQPAPAPSGGLFGAPTPAKPGGLFGAPAPAPGGLFSPTPAPASGGLFGAVPAATAPIVPPPSADALLAQQLAAVENKQKELEQLEIWRGNPPSGSKVLPTSQYDDSGFGNGWDGDRTSYAASSSLLSYRAAPRSAAKIRPRGYTPSQQSPVSLGRKIGSPILSPNNFLGSSTKTLFIKPNSLTPKPKTRLLLTNAPSNGSSYPSPATLENSNNKLHNESHVPTQELKSPTPTNGSLPKPINSTSPSAARAASSPTSPAHDFYRQVVDSTGRSPSASSPLQVENKFVPKLTKSGYNVYPSITELEVFSEADLAAVTGFKVERPGYGSVEWDGAVDVRGVDIDTVVIIESKNVSVYDEAEETGEKPQQGSKLNRPAVITMYGVYPKDGAQSSAEAKAKLTRKIKKTTEKMGAELLSFEEESGLWMFRVGHFSRYGLDDDSDDDSDDDVHATPLLEELDDDQETVELKELGGASKMHAPMDEDESTSAYTNVSATESLDQNETEEGVVYDIVRAGEEAYTMMTEEVLDDYDEEAIIPYESLAGETKDEIVPFPDEGMDDMGLPAKQLLRPALTISSPGPSVGICSKLANKCGLKTVSSSNIDFGMRMRQSFRVGWRPDGSFIVLKPSSCQGNQVLAQSKPVIAPVSGDVPNGNGSATSALLLETHQKHSIKALETEDHAPIFALPRSIARSESSSHALFNALEEYSKSSATCPLNSATQKVVSNSFSLLVSLYSKDKASGTMCESRRLEAVSTWLKEVVSSDTVQAISASQSSGDVYGSIFAALSGGDKASASSLALDGGNPRLSLMLLNTGNQKEMFFRNQLEMWHESGAQPYTPTGILRIFSMGSGSNDIERSMFKSDSVSYDIDWRRRFGMLLWSCSSNPQDQVTVSSVVKQYISDVSAGLAPRPTPLYCNESHVPHSASNTTNQCLLYQVLNHHACPDTPLIDIITPSSHTPFRHDFSAAFHLGAAMTALSSSTLTHHQEDLIVDAVTSQLIGEGLWEWAVYANLCFIGSGAITQSAAFARRLRAKNIVSRFYTPSAGSRRSFLQNIGIPPQWFVEADAYRCASEGDALGMVNNLMKFSMANSIAAMEDLIIPSMILEGKESMRRLLPFLELLRSRISDDFLDSWNKPNGCGVIHKFLQLHAQVEKLSNTPLDQIDVDIDHLLDEATELEAILSKAVEDGTTRKSLPFVKIPYGFTRAPHDVVLAEVIRMLSFLRMQLLAINNGQPLQDLDPDSYSSRLAFALPPDGLYDSSTLMGAESILRGFCGFKAMA